MQKERVVHLRRCHICGGVNEREGDAIDRCQHCHKPMAPFFFFDDRVVAVYSENEPRPSVPRVGERRALIGFTVIW